MTKFSNKNLFQNINLKLKYFLRDIFLYFENNIIGGVQMNLSTKERFLLEDQKNQEQLCVQKYQSYANMASCQQLKSIFQQIGQKEQEHYNTIDQLLKGQMPSMGQSSSQQSGGQQQSGSQQSLQMQSQQSKMTQQQPSFQQQSSPGSSGYSNSDKDLCTDMLMTEKYVSGDRKSVV